jgi:hypothetical protein
VIGAKLKDHVYRFGKLLRSFRGENHFRSCKAASMELCKVV